MQKTFKFQVNANKGSVSAVYQGPNKPKAVLVLAHGAGANMLHQHMQSIADALETEDIATFRYNFPYMESGGGRTDSLDNCKDTISAAIQCCQKETCTLPLFLGGHSFGGRMSSHFVADNSSGLKGVVYFSFPLHPSKKPDTKRASHLPNIKLPQLFISGTRDTLAEVELLKPIIGKLKRAQLHLIDTADHGFKILKRTRTSDEDVYVEAARVVKQFVEKS